MKNTCFTLLALFLPFVSFAVIGPITGATQVCLNVNAFLADTTTGGTWASSNTSVAVIGVSSGEVTGIAAGTAIITYFAHAGFVTDAIIILPLPAIDTVTGGGTFCTGGSGLPVGLNSSQTGINYFLHIGSSITGPLPGSGGALHFGTESTAGTYLVVAVNTTTSCTDTMFGSAVIAISPLVSPVVSITASPGDTVCTGTATTFLATPAYGGTLPAYGWKVNGISVGTSADTYTYIPANGDQVMVKLTSNFPCVVADSARDSSIITVLTRQRPSVSLAAIPGDTVCTGYAVTVVPGPAYGGSHPIFGWTVNGIIIDSGATFSYTPANGDFVNCVLTSNYLCLSTDTASGHPVIMATVAPVIPSFYIAALPGYTVPLGTTDTLIAIVSGSDSGLTFQWIVNYTIIPGATGSTYVYSNSDSAQLIDSISCIITSHGLCPVSTSNWTFITSSGEGVQALNALPELSVYPNPSDGIFTIQGNINASGFAELTVTDLPGRAVYSQKFSSATGAVHQQVQLPATLAPGIYLLSIHSSAGNKVLRLVIGADTH